MRKNGLTDYSLDPFNGLGANTKETPEQTVDIPFANDPTKQQLKNKQANNDKIMGKA